MTCEEALEIVVARTGHEPFRQGCAPGNPHRDHWCRQVIDIASALDGGHPVKYPPLLAQAKNAAVAAGRAVASAVHRRELPVVSHGEAERRKSICRSCEFVDLASFRCRKCGCYANLKTRVLTERCPVGKW